MCIYLCACCLKLFYFHLLCSRPLKIFIIWHKRAHEVYKCYHKNHNQTAGKTKVKILIEFRFCNVLFMDLIVCLSKCLHLYIWIWSSAKWKIFLCWDFLALVLPFFSFHSCAVWLNLFLVFSFGSMKSFRMDMDKK